MRPFESKWEGKDGTNFYMQGWEPDEKPQAIIALIHGLGEHTGRYAHVAEILTQAGHVLAGFDLRGHGKSSGQRGHFPSIDMVMQDVNEFFTFLLGRYPESLPRFIYGHSIGGLISLNYALRYKTGLKAVIVTAPALRSSLQEQKVKVALVKVLGAVFPTLTLPSGLKPADISRDPNVVEAYVNDPLVHGKITVGFGKSALDGIDYASSHAKEFSYPLLMMYGSEDKITYISGGEDFARLVAGDITFKKWDGLYHEIHNEPEQAQVFDYMLEWLAIQVKK